MPSKLTATLFCAAMMLGFLPGESSGADTANPGALPLSDEPRPELPHIVLITVDTLRADRLSFYDNPAPTSPNIDALLGRGAHFNAARTVEPLTGPAAASMLTSLHPHGHGASRNGIPIREGLRSLPSLLLQLGYVTTAFVSNWTLTDKQSGLGEHFDIYEEVLTKKRWLFWFGESDAEDVRQRTLEWLEEDGVYPGQPLFLWAHFTDPHAPYKLHDGLAEKLGVPTDGSASDLQRYDTEVAYTDRQIGILLSGLEQYLDMDKTVVIFASDHGEGLGEHGYKGHGRHLYETELRIPLGFAWPGRIEANTLRAPASLLDIPPTVMGLLGAPVPPEWEGHDWSASLINGNDGPMNRVTYYQAHKGAVKGGTSKADVAARKRQRGLLELGIVRGSEKQVLDIESGSIARYALPEIPEQGALGYAESERDPEVTDTTETVPTALDDWRSLVNEELTERDRSPPPELDDEAIERLKSLGYIN